MRRTIKAAAVLSLGATAAFAGAIYDGSCGACGYKAEGLFLGGGFYPYGVHALYAAPAWQELVVVYFDLKQLLPPEARPADDMTVDSATYNKYLGSWSCPAVITPEDWPPYANVSTPGGPDRAPTRLDLVDGGSPEVNTPYPCPRCGQLKLVFERTGFWD
jgi:hypothetical protein